MLYTISEAAEKSGINVHTLRFYDRQGLLPFIDRESNGIRRFKESDLEWLEIIRNLKRTGMKVKKIKEYLDLCMLGDVALQQRLHFMQEHKANVQRQIKGLQAHLDFTNYKVWYYETALEAGSEATHWQKYTASGVTPWQRYTEEQERKKAEKKALT